MAKPKILVTRRWPAVVEARLQEAFDATLNLDDRPMTAIELRQALNNYDAILPTVTDSLTAETLSERPMRARMLANFGVGFNHIDLEAARAAGLAVSNTPDVLTECTADLAMALLLSVARRTGEGERQLRAGRWTGWRPAHLLGTKVTGKTLGLIGFGRIGRAMARKAHHGFDMPILFYDPAPVSDDICRTLGATSCDSIESVLRNADFVALHCPGGQQNRHLIDAARLALMKPTAFLINTSRGDVVDNQALIAALRSGSIAGAGLDVYEGEPELNPEFLRLDNAVLAPHLGSATTETRTAMGMRVIANLTAFFEGRPLLDRVI